MENRLKAKARELGFELAGIARATEADGFARYREWLDRGYAGEMEYLYRNAEPRRHPESILGDVRSVLMLGMTYARSDLAPSEAAGEGNGRARVAKYAQAPDYHEFFWDKLNTLAAWLDAEVPGAQSHGVTDSAPLLERDFARRAGLGWVGKNTMLLNKEQGSFFLLSALLTTLELEPDAAFEGGHCGTCTACLDACPTGAFPEPGWLDARRCISYLTIELKTAIPDDLRPAVGDWLFGCDICQDVCPWNHRPNPAPGLPHRPDLVQIDPVDLLGMSPDVLRQRFKGTALRRANWRGLLRNAAIVLGNRGDRRALPALRDALKWDDDVVREACEWAIRQLEPDAQA
ncbi:MAG: tRNA epoxyqueuosine(34) reductase QueG, partial [Zavarzinella sp.]|nr:tRNA epoxyqueuosine(34) reductase QueG [Zavarzinella sp.]